jgi:hypothetical protein
MTGTDYDPRYLAGILFFNRGDFFEAHEAWEDLWMNLTGPERSFVQGLIQAAVALYHFGNGNVRGASKLYHTSKKYMASAGSPFWGLDGTLFWAKMDDCFAELNAAAQPDPSITLREEKIPEIVIDPQPEEWPDPEKFVDGDSG